MKAKSGTYILLAVKITLFLIVNFWIIIATIYMFRFNNYLLKIILWFKPCRFCYCVIKFAEKVTPDAKCVARFLFGKHNTGPRR